MCPPLTRYCAARRCKRVPQGVCVAQLFVCQCFPCSIAIAEPDNTFEGHVVILCCAARRPRVLRLLGRAARQGCASVPPNLSSSLSAPVAFFFFFGVVEEARA
eukprot:TRINITY_DN4880_c0_g1_i2.p3 TRINITY_DN4880_c0_g1~~TRINITY_DN4880_c0_g1_i2.p3  ORF type:complete len:103 (+),score=1.47 TRINITY_DN4880_c0_g1_i2:83-391(+)